MPDSWHIKFVILLSEHQLDVLTFPHGPPNNPELWSWLTSQYACVQDTMTISLSLLVLLPLTHFLWAFSSKTTQSF